jgi:hypothetical protein
MTMHASFRREVMGTTWYRALIERAAGRCEICRKRTTAALSLDHRHACCGPENACRACVRGLLCRACNAGLGMFQDNPALLVAAADYLIEHAATTAATTAAGLAS